MKNKFPKLYFSFNNPWHCFYIAFLISIIIRLIVISLSNSAELGWDENLYLKHTNALLDFFSNREVALFYNNYFMKNEYLVRYFPPASPLSYAFFGSLFNDPILGARIYNSLMISVGIASTTTIFWLLSKQRLLTYFIIGISNFSLTHNAYSIFMWVEGAQFALVSFIIYVSLIGQLNVKKQLFIAISLAWLNLTHASSLLFTIPIIGYLIIFRLHDSIRNKILATIVLFLPSIFVIFLWGQIAKPAIGEFVILSSEAIPMKSLMNPPSSYKDTWTSINRLSQQENLSLSAASSTIAFNYISQMGIPSLIERGFKSLKSALRPDGFPERHFKNGKWPFLSRSTFDMMNSIHKALYFIIYFGLALYLFNNSSSPTSVLIGSIFALKVASTFFTGIGLTRYFTSFYMIVFPFAIYAIISTSQDFLKKEFTLSTINRIAWSIFFGMYAI